MASFWFLLTDPGDDALDPLFRKKVERRDGVTGRAAQKRPSATGKGGRIIGDHTAPEKTAQAPLEAASDPRQNPALDDKNPVVDVRGPGKFPRPVPLAEMKAHPGLEAMKLFKRFGLMAVSRLSAAECKEICRLGGFEE